MQPPATYIPPQNSCAATPDITHTESLRNGGPLCFSLHLKAPNPENLRIAHNPRNSYWNRCKKCHGNLNITIFTYLYLIQILKNQSALLSINQGSDKGVQHCIKFKGHPGRDWCMTQREGDLSTFINGGKKYKGRAPSQ